MSEKEVELKKRFIIEENPSFTITRMCPKVIKVITNDFDKAHLKAVQQFKNLLNIEGNIDLEIELLRINYTQDDSIKSVVFEIDLMRGF